MILPAANVEITVGSSKSASPSAPVQIEVSLPLPLSLLCTESRWLIRDLLQVVSDKFALWVTMTTAAQGYFEENAFVMLAGQKKSVGFVPIEGFSHDELKESIRVEHVATYM